MAKAAGRKGSAMIIEKLMKQTDFTKVVDAIRAIRVQRNELNVPPSKKVTMYIETAETALFEGAKAFAAGGEGGEDAGFAVGKGSNQVAVFVAVTDTLLFNNPASRGGEVVSHHRERLTQLRHLFGQQRGACIALYATLPKTAVKVAAEELFHNVERDHLIVDEQHGVIRNYRF